MLSRTERALLINLIRNRIATLEHDASHPDATVQINMLRRIQSKIESGGELLTASEIRLALDAAGEPDSRHYRWIIHISDIAALADTLNAIQVQHAITGRNIINA